MQSEDGKISIVRDADGKNIVIINDIRFRGKRKMSWKEVEEFLKEYVKTYYEIEAYSEKYILEQTFRENMHILKIRRRWQEQMQKQRQMQRRQ